MVAGDNYSTKTMQRAVQMSSLSILSCLWTKPIYFGNNQGAMASKALINVSCIFADEIAATFASVNEP